MRRREMWRIDENVTALQTREHNHLHIFLVGSQAPDWEPTFLKKELGFQKNQ